ncbi:MAG: M23 family metallopeptidase [Bacteroidetes bacterium]|nr:M23 family metallopeptidase [Bacteroidota bacterium]
MKRNTKKIFLFLFLLFFSNAFVIAQKQYPINYFSSPLHIPLKLAGTFGEPRSNHLHSGLDLRTQEKEGFIVYAPANGYVSRIKVSPWGFGNALYITHPNGYVTVYGHLRGFNPAITAYLRKFQYEKENFEQDLLLPKNKIRIKKGDTIAIAGNSGGSEGPHLHFEIRDERTEKPINPLLFGLKLEDTLQPVIQSVKIFTEDGLHQSEFEVITKHKKTYLKTHDTIAVPAKFYLGIEAFDQVQQFSSKKGIYQLELYIDTSLFYKHILESFAFDESRYVNCLINYATYIKTGIKYYQTRILPGNKLSIYKYVSKKGWIQLSDNLSHQLRYNVLDVNGNCCELVFYVKRDTTLNYSKNLGLTAADSSMLITYNKTDSFITDEVKLNFPADALYDNIIMKYHSSKGTGKFLSNIHEIHDIYTPLHRNISLSIRPDSIADSLNSKLLIVRVKEDHSITAEGGKWEKGFIKTNINNFGKFAVVIDTTAPAIKPLNFRDKSNITKIKKLEIKITDNLAGLSKYNAFLNEKWILMEYDGKNNLFTIDVDMKTLEESNYLIIKAEDNRQNVSEIKFELLK